MTMPDADEITAEPPEQTSNDTTATPLVEAADQVGLCLDVDGTTHRTGSVFAESLVFLPYADAVDWEHTDRQRLREIIGRVLTYAEGESARDRWTRRFTVLDRLYDLGAGWLVTRLLHAAVRRRARGVNVSTRSHTGDDYREMRRAVLEQYGEAIAGYSWHGLSEAAGEIIDAYIPIDDALETSLGRVAAADVDIALVTDMPDHVTEPYAERLIGDPDAVAATAYPTDDRGRCTGEMRPLDKRAAVERLQGANDWDFLVAAGDSAVDLAMAEVADLFLAVEGQGDIATQLDDRDVVRVHTDTDPTDLRAALRNGRRTLYVDADTPIDGALETALRAAGALD